MVAKRWWLPSCSPCSLLLSLICAHSLSMAWLPAWSLLFCICPSSPLKECQGNPVEFFEEQTCRCFMFGYFDSAGCRLGFRVFVIYDKTGCFGCAWLYKQQACGRVGAPDFSPHFPHNTSFSLCMSSSQDLPRDAHSVVAPFLPKCDWLDTQLPHSVPQDFPPNTSSQKHLELWTCSTYGLFVFIKTWSLWFLGWKLWQRHRIKWSCHFLYANNYFSCLPPHHPFFTRWWKLMMESVWGWNLCSLFPLFSSGRS
jgi:hypothetical protein